MRFIIIVMAAFVAPSSGHAAELDVSNNAEAKAFNQLLIETARPLMQCMMQQTRAGQQSDKAKSYCLCKNRSSVEPGLEQLQALREKHPEWEGNTLVLVINHEDGEETRSFGYQQIDQIEQGLEGADQECP